MSEHRYDYVIVGGGLAGVSAIDGIRERDHGGSILLVGNEGYMPYDRPPLSKKLWLGQKRVEEIFIHDKGYFKDKGVETVFCTDVVKLDVAAKTIACKKGASAREFGKLLLATGGKPRKLPIPGGDLDGISYFRTLDDYIALRRTAEPGKSAVVIGGGFIGSEMAAALAQNQVRVTMVFPEEYVVSRVFPKSLALAIQAHYVERGVNVLAGDAPTEIEKNGGVFVTITRNGARLESDVLVVGIGIAPADDLAKDAGLAVENGVVVNEFLEASHPDVYAAGDVALFPYQALGRSMRVEHWDNAAVQGKYAGRNMAGAREAYTHMPYFFSDLFEFGYEAVGEVDSRLDTFCDWQEENEKGVVYYLKDGKVRGAMMVNVWDEVEAAREMIRSGATIGREDLAGAIG